MDLERNVASRSDAERAAAIETGTIRPDATPYAATGLKVGTFLLRPTLEQGAEWTSNAAGTAGGTSDILSSTTLRLGAQSEWSRHSLAINAAGTYRTSLQGTGFSDLSGNADATLNLELGNEFTGSFKAGWNARPEEAGSPAVTTATVGRAARQTLNAGVGLEKGVGKFTFSLNGTAERNTYGPATLSTGGLLSQTDRNNTLYAAALRGSYEISPAMKPFVEAELGRRNYDLPLDSAGYSRSAMRYGARAGIAFDRGEKLVGEIAAGWISEKPDDARLSAVSGLALDGNLAWSPIRGTTVNLATTTTIEGSTVAGSSGSVVYGATAGVTRELGSRLTGMVSLGGQLRRYAGTADLDTTWTAMGSLTYWLNRYAGITGRASHEQLGSTIAGRNSGSTSVYLGLTLQR